MGEISNIGSEPGSDIICLEGNGARPSHRGCGWAVGGVMFTLNNTEVHAICYGISSYDTSTLKYIMLENHPADSRVKISKDGKCQTLSSRMGTGGGMCR